MEFSIEIFDNSDLQAKTVFEHAEAQSLGLNWLASENKLEIINGSELAFTLEATEFQDAYFGHLNTQDERQYLVVLKNETDNKILWQGHLLPDLYDEPFESGAYFVSLAASCGLGSLKNQFLTASMYVDEHALIDYVSSCLALTGLSLDIFVAPALTCKLSKRWDNYYLPGELFVDRDKKDDAYTILEKIIGDNLCSIQQVDNAWYIYGINKKNRFEVTYQQYDAGGVFKRNKVELKSPKTFTFLGIPRVKAVTPMKLISAFYELDEQQLEEALYKVKNDGYVLSSDEDIVNHKWAYTSVGYTAKFNTADGRVYFAPLALDLDESLTMRRELLVEAGQRIEWLIEMTNFWSSTAQQGRTVEEIVNDGDWQKLQPYDIFYTNPNDGSEVLLFSNVNGSNPDDLRYQLPFNADRKASLRIKMIAPVTAYYNIRFYQPQGTAGLKVERVYLDALEANILDTNEEQRYDNETADNYTKALELELSLHDDMRDINGFIRQTPLEQFAATYDTEMVTITQAISNASGTYVRVAFNDLHMLLEHQNNLTVSGSPLVVVDHIYNYLGAQEFLLGYDAVDFGRELTTSDQILVTMKAFAGIPANIADWQQWTDDFYGVSFGRYGKIASDILRNLYTNAHPYILATVQGFVSPRDLVQFAYDGDKIFYVLKAAWELDANQSQVILCQNFYGEAVTDNLPPSVYAGPDISLAQGVTTSSLLATASDPDGSIVSVLWELISPVGGSVTIDNPDQLGTDISGLTGDRYEFRVTVTDDVGLTDSDTVVVNRVKNYQLVLTPRVVHSYTNQWEDYDEKSYYIEIDPPLVQGQTARIVANGVLLRETPVDIAGARPSVMFGVNASGVGIVGRYFEAGSYEIITLKRTGEEHIVLTYAKAFNSAVGGGVYDVEAGDVHARVQVDIEAQIIEGPEGVFTNTPVQFTVDARK